MNQFNNNNNNNYDSNSEQVDLHKDTDLLPILFANRDNIKDGQRSEFELEECLFASLMRDEAENAKEHKKSPSSTSMQATTHAGHLQSTHDDNDRNTKHDHPKASSFASIMLSHDVQFSRLYQPSSSHAVDKIFTLPRSNHAYADVHRQPKTSSRSNPTHATDNRHLMTSSTTNHVHANVHDKPMTSSSTNQVHADYHSKPMTSSTTNQVHADYHGKPMTSSTTNRVRADAHGKPMTRISSLSQLQPADHIAWPFSRWSELLHHAIVIVVNDPRDQLTVIHYKMAPDWRRRTNGCLDLFTIRLDDISPRFDREDVFRFEYGPEECLAVEDVIGRAVSRHGEATYSVRRNNCEHYARWCKTGVSVSYQAAAVRDWIPLRMGFRRAARRLSGFGDRVAHGVVGLVTSSSSGLRRFVGESFIRWSSQDQSSAADKGDRVGFEESSLETNASKRSRSWIDDDDDSENGNKKRRLQ